MIFNIIANVIFDQISHCGYICVTFAICRRILKIIFKIFILSKKITGNLLNLGFIVKDCIEFCMKKIAEYWATLHITVCHLRDKWGEGRR